MDNKYLSLQGLGLYTELVLNELKSYITQSIYGIVDGTIERINNDKAIYVRDYLFYNHQSLTTAAFPAALNIGDYSFYKCPVLSSVSIPLATEIGDFAFKGCSDIATIDFPNVTIIGNGSFDECITLSSVNLPLLTKVSSLMFRQCESLTSIELPSVTSIETQAFWSSGIASLTLNSNTVCTLADENAFYFTPIEEGTGFIYVPSDLVDSYKVADGWSVYANQIRAIA